MSRWMRWARQVSVGCNSVCFLGLPLLMLWWPAAAAEHSFLHGRLFNSLLALSVALYVLGAADAWRHHRRWVPPVCGVVSLAVLVGTMWRLLPAWIGWPAWGALMACWLWERRLLRSGARCAMETR